MPSTNAHHPLRWITICWRWRVVVTAITISRLRRIIRLIVISPSGRIISTIVTAIMTFALVFVLVSFSVTMIIRMTIPIVIMVMRMPMTMMPPACFGRQWYRQYSTQQHNQSHVSKRSRFDFHNNLPSDVRQF